MRRLPVVHNIVLRLLAPANIPLWPHSSEPDDERAAGPVLLNRLVRMRAYWAVPPRGSPDTWICVPLLGSVAGGAPRV